MCATILFVSLYLDKEVRADVQEDRQLAASTGVVARPGFVARAGDRRLLTGAASLVRIFLLSPTRATLGSEQSQLPRTPLLGTLVNNAYGPMPKRALTSGMSSSFQVTP